MATPAPEAPVEEPATPAAPVEPETVSLTKPELEALRRQAAEGAKAQRKFEADQKKAEEERQRQQGEFQQLAETKDRELQQERSERSRMEREARVTRLATRLKFQDPADVVGRITADDGAEDSLTEAALERIAQQSPHLVQKDGPVVPEIGQVLAPSATAVPGAPVGDGKPPPPAGKAPLASLDEWEALPQAERLARMAESDWLYLHDK